MNNAQRKYRRNRHNEAVRAGRREREDNYRNRSEAQLRQIIQQSIELWQAVPGTIKGMERNKV